MTDEFALAKAIENGTLELLCTKMQLLQCPSNDEVLMEGTGVIRSRKGGRLSFQMVSPMKGLPHPTLRPNRPLGEINEPDDFVRLCAVDHRGREWRSNEILAKPVSPNSGSPNWLVVEDIRSLLCRSYSRTHSNEGAATIYIPRQDHLPFDVRTHITTAVGGKTIQETFSSDHHVRRIGNGDVEFRKVDDHWLTITTTQSTPIMPDWNGLMCHAIQFATGKNARPALLVREFGDRVDIGMESGPFMQYRSFLTPPLIERWRSTANDFWSLVQLFFEWSQSHEKDRKLVFEELQGIRNGASGSIQTACLTLAIGIESLALVLLRDEEVQRDPSEAKQVEGLIQHVTAWDGDEALKHRARTMLGQIGNIRAVDRLYAFAKRTNVPDKAVKAWKRLRDMRAHGGATEEQELHDLYYSAVELLYRMICSVIGYTGPIAETSKRGWGLERGV